MAVSKAVSSNKLPLGKKKTILQQVMKPKDWVMLGILIVFSAVCWTLVLNAYQNSISLEGVISANSSIDNKAKL